MDPAGANSREKSKVKKSRPTVPFKYEHWWPVYSIYQLFYFLLSFLRFLYSGGLSLAFTSWFLLKNNSVFY
jgi:hypothetical protein